jgi:hypothetical protein
MQGPSCLTYGSTPYVYLPTTVYSLMSVFTDRSAPGAPFAPLRVLILSLKQSDCSTINQNNENHFYRYFIMIALLVHKLSRHKEPYPLEYSAA